MKRFEIYKNIRKRAIIFGLPVSLFALIMISVLASLMLIIFSFSFVIIIGVFMFNAALYVALIQIANNVQGFHLANTFQKL